LHFPEPFLRAALTNIYEYLRNRLLEESRLLAQRVKIAKDLLPDN